MSTIMYALSVLGGIANADVQSQLPPECNLYGQIFCLPITEQVQLHTHSPSEDFVLHDIKSVGYSMRIYEGNAPHISKNVAASQIVDVDGREYHFTRYEVSSGVRFDIYSPNKEWPTSVQIVCKNLKQDACKKQLLLIKACSRSNDDVTCNDDYVTILKKTVWVTEPL